MLEPDPFLGVPCDDGERHIDLVAGETFVPATIHAVIMFQVRDDRLLGGAFALQPFEARLLMVGMFRTSFGRNRDGGNLFHVLWKIWCVKTAVTGQFFRFLTERFFSLIYSFFQR